MDELDSIIRQINEEFGEGTITTANEIPRPERALEKQAIDDFMDRNPMAGGGRIEFSTGTDKKNFGKRGAKKITINGKDYRLISKGPNTGKVSFPTTLKGKDITLYLTPKQLKKRLDAPRETPLTEGMQTKLKTKIDKNVNNWSKNWVKNNIKNYGVRDFENFTTDMASAWAEELKNNPNKYPSKYGVGTNLTNELGLPVVRGGFQIEGITFPQRPDRLGFKPELTWQKLFINNKLKDKDFKTKVNSYLDWNLTKKVEGGAGSMTKTAALDYGKFKKGFDDDVIYLMGEVLNNRALNPGGGQVGINDVFKKVFGKKGEAYFKKYEGSWSRWRNNFFEVASLAGLDKSQADALLQKQINDSQKIMKLYNVKNLPPEFVVAQDHLFGLAEAKALGDPKIARQTLRALVATTKEQNRILGQEGFSNKRVNLIKKFKNASLENKANIVNQLNTLAEEYVPGRLQYNIKKDGSLKITNLRPETTFREKAIAYKNLAKNFPLNIKKQFALLGGGKCGTKGFFNQGGRVGLQDGTLTINKCFEEALKRIRKGGVDFTRAEAMNFNKLTKGLRAIGASNIMKFGILPEVLFEGALIADKMASEGDSFMQGLRNSYVSIPFQAMGMMKTYEEGRKDEILAAAPESQRGKVLDVMSMQDTLKKRNELAAQSQNLKNQIEDTDRISDGAFGYVGDSQDLQKRLSETRADLQDLYRGDASRAERMLTSSPLDLNIKDELTMNAYKSAVEKADADRASNILFAPGTNFGVDTQIKKRMKELPITPEYAKEQLKATGDYYGKGYTPYGLNKLFTLFGRQNPKFGFDEEGKYSEEKGLNDYMNYLRTLNFAENFRDEKAGGGIAKLAGVDQGPPPKSGPNPQGLQGLMKRVKNI